MLLLVSLLSLSQMLRVLRPTETRSIESFLRPGMVTPLVPVSPLSPFTPGVLRSPLGPGSPLSPLGPGSSCVPVSPLAPGAPLGPCRPLVFPVHLPLGVDDGLAVELDLFGVDHTAFEVDGSLCLKCVRHRREV